MPTEGFVQNISMPSLHGSHSPHESTRQPTPTRSPTACRVTSSPTSSTVPAISWPTVNGKCAGPHSSRTVWMSEWQMPAKAMAMRTSSGRRSRRSIVPCRNPEVAESAMSAGVVVGIPQPYVAQSWGSSEAATSR